MAIAMLSFLAGGGLVAQELHLNFIHRQIFVFTEPFFYFSTVMLLFFFLLQFKPQQNIYLFMNSSSICTDVATSLSSVYFHLCTSVSLEAQSTCSSPLSDEIVSVKIVSHPEMRPEIFFNYTFRLIWCYLFWHKQQEQHSFFYFSELWSSFSRCCRFFSSPLFLGFSALCFFLFFFLLCLLSFLNAAYNLLVCQNCGSFS